jgi:hypothetical protein
LVPRDFTLCGRDVHRSFFPSLPPNSKVIVNHRGPRKWGSKRAHILPFIDVRRGSVRLARDSCYVNRVGMNMKQFSISYQRSGAMIYVEFPPGSHDTHYLDIPDRRRTVRLSLVRGGKWSRRSRWNRSCAPVASLQLCTLVRYLLRWHSACLRISMVMHSQRHPHAADTSSVMPMPTPTSVKRNAGRLVLQQVQHHTAIAPRHPLQPTVKITGTALQEHRQSRNRPLISPARVDRQLCVHGSPWSLQCANLTRTHLIYLFKNRLWKSLRTVSLMNRLASFFGSRD